MAGNITVNSPNRETRQEDHQEDYSPAASNGGMLAPIGTAQLPQVTELSDLIRLLTERFTRDDTSATALNQHSDRQNLNESHGHQLYDELVRTREREAEFIKTINTMKSQMHRATSSAPDIDKVLEEAQQTPFSSRISDIDMRQVGKIKMPSYDGTTLNTTDPSNHLTAFTIATGRVRLSPEERDAALCQLFVEKLSGAALHWFSKLKPNTIDSFGELSQAFLKHYSMFIIRGASSADLWSLNQKKGERLRSFIDRFKAIASKVTMDDDASIEALRRGLWYEGRFRETLSSSRPLTLEDALHRATTYVNIEEEQDSLQKQHAPRASSSSRDVRPKETHHEPRQHFESYKDDGGQKRDATYAISNDQSTAPWNRYVRPRESARQESQQIGHDEPRVSRPCEGKFNPTLYCDFHKRNGHATSECRQLQDVLLGKYQQGEVQDVIASSYYQPSTNQPGTDNPSNQEIGRPLPRSTNGDVSPSKRRTIY